MADDNTTTTTGANDDSKPAARIDETVEPMATAIYANLVVPTPRAQPIPQTISGETAPASAAISVTVPVEDETEFERIQRLKLNTDEAPHSGAINDDIAQILQEVKLPERRDFKGAADAKQPAKQPAVTPTSTKKAKQGDDTPKKRDIVTALHTLKDDLQDVVLIRKMSLVRASALEQDKKRGQPEVLHAAQTPGALQRNRRAFGFIFFSLLMIALGGAALYGVTVVTQGRTTAAAPQFPSLIFAERTSTVPLDNTNSATLKQAVLQARNQTNSPLSSIMHIVPVYSSATAGGTPATTLATLPQFLAALGARAPDQLLRGLGNTFFFGIHTIDIGSPVFVIPVTSYDLAFSGMLAWESTMNEDLAPAFDSVPTLVAGPDGLPRQRTFNDAVILNYDVRELKDDGGNIVLYYSFPTPNLLIISESVHSFPEILSRLQAQRML